jgi:hypothetical protein
VNIQSNLSDSSQEYDLQPLQLEIHLFSQFSAQATCPEGTLCPIFHQDSSCCPGPLQDKENGKTPATPLPPLQSPPPRQGKRNDAQDTAAAAAVTAATSDRRGTLVAVGLSLLSAALSPGAIAMVVCGIKHS